MEIIQEDHEEYMWMKPYLEIIESRIDKEKIREWSQKRWKEYLENHKMQRYYWGNTIWSDIEWEKSKE